MASRDAQDKSDHSDHSDDDSTPSQEELMFNTLAAQVENQLNVTPARAIQIAEKMFESDIHSDKALSGLSDPEITALATHLVLGFGVQGPFKKWCMSKRTYADTVAHSNAVMRPVDGHPPHAGGGGVVRPPVKVPLIVTSAHSEERRKLFNTPVPSDWTKYMEGNSSHGKPLTKVKLMGKWLAYANEKFIGDPSEFKTACLERGNFGPDEVALIGIFDETFAV